MEQLSKIPNYRCSVTEQEFIIGLATDYTEVYITRNNGSILKHTALSHGRFIRMKVDDIPGKEKSTIEEQFNFLPDGKIPIKFFHDIHAFFVEVMKTLKAGPEAMAHILWNPTDGYHIGIPEQQVSAASVKYEFNHLKDDDVIIVDIHSHNNMASFFSSTDNNDDANRINYSGVFGKLNQKDFEYKWRFNFQGQKFEATLEDIFETGVQGEVDPEWLKKVKTYSTSYPAKYQPGTYGSQGKGTTRSTKDPRNHDSYGYGYGNAYGFRSGYGAGYGDLSDYGFNFDGEDDSSFFGTRGTHVDSESTPAQEQLTLEELKELMEGMPSGHDFHDSFDEIGETDVSLAAHVTSAEIRDLNAEELREYAQEQIESWADYLENDDNKLLDCISNLYSLLSDKGQERLSREGINSL